MKKINQILPWPIFKFRKTNFSYLFLTEWIESWTFVAFVRGFLFFSFIKSCFVLLILFASKTWIFVALSECAIPWISLTYTNKNHQSWRCNSSANSTHELMQKNFFFTIYLDVFIIQIRSVTPFTWTRQQKLKRELIFLCTPYFCIFSVAHSLCKHQKLSFRFVTNDLKTWLASLMACVREWALKQRLHIRIVFVAYVNGLLLCDV